MYKVQLRSIVNFLHSNKKINVSNAYFLSFSTLCRTEITHPARPGKSRPKIAFAHTAVVMFG